MCRFRKPCPKLSKNQERSQARGTNGTTISRSVRYTVRTQDPLRVLEQQRTSSCARHQGCPTGSWAALGTGLRTARRSNELDRDEGAHRPSRAKNALDRDQHRRVFFGRFQRPVHRTSSLTGRTPPRFLGGTGLSLNRRPHRIRPAINARRVGARSLPLVSGTFRSDATHDRRP